MTNSQFNMVITGGKTGGHLFPGIAIAQAIEQRCDHTSLLFVGTNAPFETKTLASYGYAHRAIFSRPLKGGNILSKAWSIFLILVSLVQSIYILKSYKPDFVLGVGGFSSFAVVLAAWLLGIPRAIAEQNAMPGLTNRMLSRFVDAIFTSFKETKGFSTHPKVKFVGNPVRRTGSSPAAGSEELTACSPGKFTILVTGGSQGASSINRAFIDALALLDNPGQYNIIHQTGKTDEKIAIAAYQELGITADVRAFFKTMPQIQAMSDLVITRAGAGTLFELSTAGVAAILIPFPHAADDHQTHNARALENQGAAMMLKDADLTGSLLKKTMVELIENTEKRQKMARRFKSFAMPDADLNIAAHILKLKDKKA